jgi:hypothetical protein
MTATKQDINLRPAWAEEDHKLLVDMSSQLTILATEYQQTCKDLAGQKRTLYGPNGDDGLVTETKEMANTQKITNWILGSIGVASLGGVMWLIETVISMGTQLSKVAIR